MLNSIRNLFSKPKEPEGLKLPSAVSDHIYLGIPSVSNWSNATNLFSAPSSGIYNIQAQVTTQTSAFMYIDKSMTAAMYLSPYQSVAHFNYVAYMQAGHVLKFVDSKGNQLHANILYMRSGPSSFVGTLSRVVWPERFQYVDTSNPLHQLAVF